MIIEINDSSILKLISEPLRGRFLEYYDHFNEPVLTYDDVARLIGYGEDDEDAYWIALHCNGKRVWHSAVSDPIYLRSLKGNKQKDTVKGPFDDLQRIDTYLELNGAPKVNEFIVNLREIDRNKIG